jgi:hypothetical protein
MMASSISHHRTPMPPRRRHPRWYLPQEQSHCRSRIHLTDGLEETRRPWSRHGTTTRTRPVVSPPGAITSPPPPEARCSPVSSRLDTRRGRPIPVAVPDWPRLASVCSELPQTRL